MTRRLVAFAATTVVVLGAMFVPQPAGARSGVVTAKWSSAGSPKQTVSQTSAVFLKGKVYMPGGWKPGFSAAYDRMQILKPGSNKWSVDAEPMPEGGLAQMAVCTDGSTISVVNGIDGGGVVHSSLQFYDPSNPQGSRWSTGPNPATSPDGAVSSRDGGCAWLGGKLYLFGGDAQSTNGTISGISDFTLVFDPGTQTWSNTGMKMMSENWTFAYASDGSKAYVAGGQDANGVYKRTVAVFAPGSGWSKLAGLPKPKGGGAGYEWPGLGFLGNQLAVFGGLANDYQTRTLVCSLPCAPGSGWTNANKNLKVGRAEFGSASGGTTPTLYAIDGDGPQGFVSTAEKTT